MSNCIPLEKNAGISRVWVALDLRCILLTPCTNRKHTVLSKGKRKLRQIPCQPVAMQQWNTARFKNLSMYLRFGEFLLAIPSYMDVFLCHTYFKPHHGCYFHSLLLQQVPSSWLTWFWCSLLSILVPSRCPDGYCETGDTSWFPVSWYCLTVTQEFLKVRKRNFKGKWTQPCAGACLEYAYLW